MKYINLKGAKLPTEYQFTELLMIYGYRLATVFLVAIFNLLLLFIWHTIPYRIIIPVIILLLLLVPSILSMKRHYTDEKGRTEAARGTITRALLGLMFIFLLWLLILLLSYWF